MIILKNLKDEYRIFVHRKNNSTEITDIYATSVDYAPTLDISIDFFKTVQNKLHWAITGQTAAEIISLRANSKKENMGLTN